MVVSNRISVDTSWTIDLTEDLKECNYSSAMVCAGKIQWAALHDSALHAWAAARNFDSQHALRAITHLLLLPAAPITILIPSLIPKINYSLGLSAKWCEPPPLKWQDKALQISKLTSQAIISDAGLRALAGLAVLGILGYGTYAFSSKVDATDLPLNQLVEPNLNDSIHRSVKYSLGTLAACFGIKSILDNLLTPPHVAAQPPIHHVEQQDHLGHGLGEGEQLAQQEAQIRAQQEEAERLAQQEARQRAQQEEAERVAQQEAQIRAQQEKAAPPVQPPIIDVPPDPLQAEEVHDVREDQLEAPQERQEEDLGPVAVPQEKQQKLEDQPLTEEEIALLLSIADIDILPRPTVEQVRQEAIERLKDEEKKLLADHMNALPPENLATFMMNLDDAVSGGYLVAYVESLLEGNNNDDRSRVVAEANAFFDHVLSDRFIREECADDGDCFYHAVSHYLGCDMMTVRKDLADYISKNRDRIVSEAGQDLVLLELLQEDTIDSAIRAINNKAGDIEGREGWAEIPHAKLISWVYRVPVIVFSHILHQLESSPMEFNTGIDGKPFEGNKPPIILFNNGVNHWDRLVPKPQQQQPVEEL
ncbi:MAG: hypothetical protein Q8K75_01480 [Chlamydiales bacterium]|nr:hypothetical protein [Chlamydiales bacterium]